jgi:hypothetical protein
MPYFNTTQVNTNDLLYKIIKRVNNYSFDVKNVT